MPGRISSPSSRPSRSMSKYDIPIPHVLWVGFSRSCAYTACAKRSSSFAIVPVSAIGVYLTASARRATLPALDQLDPVAIGVAHEAQPRAAVADRVRRTLGLDSLLAKAREC